VTPLKSVWDPAVRQDLAARLQRLSPELTPAWGRFTAPQMLAHVVDALGMAFGDVPTKSKRLPLRHPPLKQLVIYWLPFPRNAPTATELISRVPASWDGEVGSCRTLIERFAREPRARTWPEHPAFGPLDARQWGILAYRHTDHHFRQFGV